LVGQVGVNFGSATLRKLLGLQVPRVQNQKEICKKHQTL